MQNSGVIITNPGFANSLAALIDNFELSSILGTIDGVYTIFLVLRENVDRQNFMKFLEAEIKQLKENA